MDMDAVNATETEAVKDIPPIPIKTYQWEDVRRERKRGRYPYTHLYKQPYNEELDPSKYRMDTLKTSRSASALEKSSSGVDIQDVTETKGLNNGKDYLEVEGIVEAADSSNEDNVSQYLDKDDDRPIIMEHIEVPGPSKEDEKMDIDDRQDQRAKSEEPKRKRKLSIESSYSRISLSKLGVMKKLRDTKDKLKLPKFSFSKSESKLDIPKKSKKATKKSKESPKKSIQSYIEPKKAETPVYIHIPLKPPPGQTDEFSYLEFEDPKSDTREKPKSSTNLSKPEEEKRNGEVPSEEKETEGVQFIFLTAPSDEEVLEDHSLTPDTPSEGAKKFFDNAKLKDLKSLAKECVDDISPDMPIDGIIFEDIIQVEYVDEHNRPIGTTERSNILEITEENLPKIEKQLSQRNLVKELQKEIASSMDSLHKIARQNTLKKLKEQQKSKSNEMLKQIGDNKQRTTQEAPELTTCKAINDPEEKSEGKNKKVEESLEIKTETSIEEKKEVPKLPEENPQREEADKKEAMYDEEDGLKLSETAVEMINEELAKEQLPKTTEEELKSAAKTGSVKKKVSFRRRSKQQDPDGVYEDVRVTSDAKKVDGKEQQTKELNIIEPSQSMSVDEEKTYLDDKIIKTTSLEEDYNKWSKVTDHEYEPISSPTESEVQQQQLPTSENQVTDAQVKRTSSKQSKKSPSNSIRIRLKDEASQSEEEMDSEDALTAKEMQERIEDQFFNKTSSTSQQEDRSTTPTTPTNTSIRENEPQESHAKKFQNAFKTQAGKFRNKIKNIKKPNIHMPQRPNLEKFKIQKPNINMPKIPDTMRVNLPSFTLPKRDSSAKKRPVKQCSTESNVGDSKKKIFDFSTYPRFFRKKKKPDDLGDDDMAASATVPRAKKAPKSRSSNFGKAKESEKKKKSPDVIRIPLHSKESMDKDDNDLSSRGRYEEQNIDMDDDYLRETQEINTASAFNASDFGRNRWNHGSFHGHNLNEIADNENTVKVTDLDSEMDRPQTSPEPDTEPERPRQSDVRSVSSTGDVDKPGGVLEKINSDEYFMQMGNYLSTELREAFQQPTNPLAKLETDDSFDREFDVSDQSIQEVPKRRAIKKPKRKNTPNVSTEGLPYDQESEPEEYQQRFNEQPTRPKRKSKQKKKKDEKQPYQESQFVQDPEFEMRKAASDNILLAENRMDDDFHNGHFGQNYPQFYENERMQGIEQPNILISPYMYEKENFLYHDDEDINLNGYDKDIPEAPPRKQKSLKSLVSEHDSITDEINFAKQNIPQQNVEVYKLEHEYIIPRPEAAPARPSRTRSRTRSHSRATDQPEEEPIELSDPTTEMPCVEEPCVQQVCDYMGYAVIEKNKHREPPLPPPTRRKKSNTATKSEAKFFTVPRPLKEDVPVRPIRNYSTLVPKSQRSPTNLSEEEKENIDLGQYIEIDDDDEHSRLQSGEIVQKMKARPLPAPPRPPRKTKDSDKDAPFKDITHENNVDEEKTSTERLEETEASVQTEPLPDDLVCEELIQEKGDKIITPTTNKIHPPITEFENVETVTHGALVVSPLADDFQEGPLTSFSRSTEKIITIRREVDHEDETTDIPENFKSLKEPQPVAERVIERPIQSSSEVEVLKAQKLQVSDLDIDRLMVNELLANKIKVSEIDSESISVAEINPKSGNLVIGGLELPINFIQDIIEKLSKSQARSEEQSSASQQIPEQSQHEQSKEESAISAEKDKHEGIDKERLIEDESTAEKRKDFRSTETDKGVKPPEPPSQKPEEPTACLNEDDHQKLMSEQEEVMQKETGPAPPEGEKKILFQPDPELSPTSLKATIDYLDDLIRQENLELTFEESFEKPSQVSLEPAAVESKSESMQPIDVVSITKQSSGEEKSDSVDLQDVPPLVLDTSEEEKLIEELKSPSPGQKKNSD